MRYQQKSPLWFFVFGAWSFLFLIGVLGGIAEYAKYWQSLQSATQPTVAIPTPSPLPLDPNISPPPVSAGSIWMYDRMSQSVLYEKNSASATSAASLAKLMTALVAEEIYSLEKPIPVGTAAAVLGNRAKFLSRDIFSSADMLRAMLIFSANDAAQALVYADESEATFLSRMNEKARQLGMNSSHFVNGTGLDHPQQYASARDLGVLTNAVLDRPFLAEVVAQAKWTVKERGTNRLDTVYTTNVLLNRSLEFQGVKTGTTEQAGQNVIVRYQTDLPPEATLSGRPRRASAVAVPVDIVLVVMGSQDRYGDSLALVQWLETALASASATTTLR